MALEALAKFAEMLYEEGESQNANVEVLAQNIVHDFPTITSTNAAIVQSYEV